MAPPPETEGLNARIARLAPPGVHVVVGLSVRTLFDALLSEINQDAPVAFSGMTIAHMPEIARAHGRRVEAWDLNLTDLSVRPGAADGRVVVIAQLYGRRPALPPLPGAALVIEDCAQAFAGSLDVGEGADVTLWSFGPIKTATALGGAVAVLRDADLAARLRARLAAYPPLPEAWLRKRALRTAALKMWATPLGTGLTLNLLDLAGRDADAVLGGAARGFPGAEVPQAFRRAPPAVLVALLARRLEGWAPPSSDAQVDAAARALGSPGAEAPGRWWLLPVLTARPDALVSALRSRGQDATRGATSMRPVADEGGRTPPNAARLAAEVVYLPKPGTAAQAGRLIADVRLSRARPD
ncbi:MAG TPA: DegT/DnrJ/EryC1/StrS family aminotransferase [Brevundimonas sp.]|uniref:DegT/DnrJ/EryC1/StrS family aminotransferase n=1 Tax=Brevundimonas sp. TaxID=1871086 RepID=UPI002DF2A0EE|nr:DegT/DnrJ/EryC1/StrS family aminotransferase [Brevundimonas sp.]